MRLLTKYTNGNYNVKLFSDGTKIRYNDLDYFAPSFAESMDITITEKCSGVPEYDNGKLCEYCYLCCNPKGKHADLNNPILDTIHPGIELAINANDCSHPDLENFLIRMKDKGVFVNMTINQKHLVSNINKLIDWQSRQLIWGIGISLIDSADPNLINCINKLNNTVIHVIDGCFTKQDLENLKNKNIKLLILGFKHKGRGVDYYNKHKEEVDNNIDFLKNHLYDYTQNFNGFGFDNLATKNLNIRKLVGEEKWSKYHMGSEGEFTLFLDLVNKRYAVSSMETENIFDLKPDDTIDTIFHHVRSIVGFDN